MEVRRWSADNGQSQERTGSTAAGSGRGLNAGASERLCLRILMAGDTCAHVARTTAVATYFFTPEWLPS
jgi:hypothetical protein